LAQQADIETADLDQSSAWVSIISSVFVTPDVCFQLSDDVMLLLSLYWNQMVENYIFF